MWPKSVTLEHPLILSTDDPDAKYQLPPGTTLVLAKRPREGGYDVYKVYINVFGPTLPLEKSEKPWSISPLTAFWEDSLAVEQGEPASSTESIQEP